jgi:hypothetical protein
MSKEGVSRRTAFRRLKAKHKARLAKAARMGNGRDPRNGHPDGYHPTPPRGARALLARESFKGVIWGCACGDGAISRILEAEGLEVISTYLVDRGYGRGGHDFLADNAALVDHIITNPPYGPARGLSAQFVEHALTRIRPGGTVCMLLRTNWEAPRRTSGWRAVAQVHILPPAENASRRLHRQEAQPATGCLLVCVQQRAHRADADRGAAARLRRRATRARRCLMIARREPMATRDRWLLVEDNDDLWLIKREGSEVRGRIVSGEGLRREFPRLYDQLVASDHKDTPRIVVER